jgi:hypothetical protein
VCLSACVCVLIFSFASKGRKGLVGKRCLRVGTRLIISSRETVTCVSRETVRSQVGNPPIPVGERAYPSWETDLLGWEAAQSGVKHDTDPVWKQYRFSRETMSFSLGLARIKSNTLYYSYFYFYLHYQCHHYINTIRDRISQTNNNCEGNAGSHNPRR